MTCVCVLITEADSELWFTHMCVRLCCPLTWSESERSWRRTSMSCGWWTRSSWAGHTAWWVHWMFTYRSIICKNAKTVRINKPSSAVCFLLSEIETVMCDTAEIMIRTDAVFPHDCCVPCSNRFSPACETVNSSAYASNLLARLWSAVTGSQKMSKRKGGQRRHPACSDPCSRYCKHLTEVDLYGSCEVKHQLVLLPLTLYWKVLKALLCWKGKSIFSQDLNHLNASSRKNAY